MNLKETELSTQQLKLSMICDILTSCCLPAIPFIGFILQEVTIISEYCFTVQHVGLNYRAQKDECCRCIENSKAAKRANIVIAFFLREME